VEKIYFMAGATGLEPATFDVTSQRSNRTELYPLTYPPVITYYFFLPTLICKNKILLYTLFEMIKIKRLTPRPYRVITIVRPTLSPERALSLVKSLTPAGITVINQTASMHSLAYVIDGNRQGHLIVTDITALPEVMWEMRRKLEVDDNILRVMSVTNTEKSLSVKLKEENIRSIIPYMTKMGKISIPRVPRGARSKISQTIKRYRFLSIVPFVQKQL